MPSYAAGSSSEGHTNVRCHPWLIPEQPGHRGGPSVIIFHRNPPESRINVSLQERWVLSDKRSILRKGHVRRDHTCDVRA